ncbi:MAG: hypothetical protein Q8L64_05210 [bacterium]|nr:hypothetical protein [bacterium]
MKKSITIIVVVAILALAVYAVLRTAGLDDSSVENGGLNQNAPVNSIEVRGVVTVVDLEQAMFDGPYVIMVRGSDGVEEIIAVPSMGIMLCAARDAIVDVSTIKEGMTVEARGSMTSRGDIVPCESSSHYLRIIQ